MYVLSKLLLCLAAIVAGAVSMELFHRETHRGASAQACPTCADKPPAVLPPDKPNEIRFEGKTEVSEDRVARVTFKEGERVFEVAVRPGQVVKPGDLLFTLKGVHLQQLEQAAAQSVAAKRKRLQAATELAAEKKRIVGVVRELQAKGNSTADELRRAESDAVQAERAVEYHQSQLREQELVHASARSMANDEYVTLPEGFRHPSGLVRRVTITPGDMRRGTAFQGVEVVNLDEVIVRVVLPPADRQKLAALRRAISDQKVSPGPGAMPTALRGHAGPGPGDDHMPTQSRGHGTRGGDVKVIATFDGIDLPATLAPPGLDADADTGAVPTLVTIDNTREPRLPIGARVAVRITTD